MKKIMSAFMAVIMLMLTITSAALAAEPNDTQGKTETTIELSKELQQKADPYVELKSMQFTLTEDASKNLTEDEINLVKKALNQANAQAKKIPNDAQISISDHNSIKITPTQPPTSKITAASINTSAYWDYELFWWGYRIFLSHQFIEDIKSRPLYIAGSAAISTGLLNAALTSCGAPGWIANIIIGITIIKGGTILYSDSGYGVYIDAFWSNPLFPSSAAINFYTSKVYAAW